MSKRAKYRAKRDAWLAAHACCQHPYQVAERMNDDAQKALDLVYLAALRERGFIDEPYPKKPVGQAHTGAGTSPGDRASDRDRTEAS